LSAREKQGLDLLVEGRPSKLIAYDLGISPPDCGASSLGRDEEEGGKSLSHLVRKALHLQRNA